MRRVRPVLALAVVSFAAGAVLGIHHSAPPGDALADQFVTAWTRREYTSMYSDLGASSRRSTSLSEFVGDYEDALRIATATQAQTGVCRLGATRASGLDSGSRLSRAIPKHSRIVAAMIDRQQTKMAAETTSR